MAKRSRLRSFVFSVLVVGISLTFCLLIFEFVIASFLYAELDNRVDTQFDPELGWTYVPGTYTVKADDSFVPHEIHINQMGLRDASPDAWPRDGMRIVVLGDLFTFAKVVSDDDVYTKKLESLLASGIPLMRSLIREIETAVVAQGGRLLVMFVPSAFMIYPETYGPMSSRSFPDDVSVELFVNDPARP